MNERMECHQKAHNLKVVGSNPTPATKYLNDKNDLRPAETWGFLLPNSRGSTVEAQGNNSTQWQRSNAQEKFETSIDPLKQPAPTFAALSASLARDGGPLPHTPPRGRPEGTIRHGPLLDPLRHYSIGGRGGRMRGERPTAAAGRCVGCRAAASPDRPFAHRAAIFRLKRRCADKPLIDTTEREAAPVVRYWHADLLLAAPD